jgi:hypothetical protein
MLCRALYCIWLTGCSISVHYHIASSGVYVQGDFIENTVDLAHMIDSRSHFVIVGL